MRHAFRSWKSLSAIGALAYSCRTRKARVYLNLVAGTVRSPEVVRFLKHLRRHIRGPVVLLWDGLQAHRSRETRAHLEANTRWLTVHRLPAYAPELNPVEGMWSWYKGGIVANLCADGLHSIRKYVHRGGQHLRRCDDVLWGFLKKAGLFF